MRGTTGPILDRLNKNVVSPSHYTVGNTEVIDVIKDCLGTSGFQAYCTGQVLKYVLRAKHKANYIEDLQKAQFYLSTLLGSDPRKPHGNE